MFNPFGAFAGTAAGIPEGYNSYQDMRAKKLRNQEAEDELAAWKALGKFDTSQFNAPQIPGALLPGVPPGAYPMPSMPGQPSMAGQPGVPSQPPMWGQSFPTPMPSPQERARGVVGQGEFNPIDAAAPPAMAPSPTSPVSQGWGVAAGALQPGGPFQSAGPTEYISPERAAQIARGPQPEQGTGMPMAPPATSPEVSAQRVPPQGGPPPQQPGNMPTGPLTWQSIAQGVAKANPGERPEIIARAVTKFLPRMTAQSQMEWKQVLAAQREASLGIREAEHERRTRQGDERIAAEAKKREEIEGRFKTREQRYAAKEAFQRDTTLQRLQLQEQALKERVEASKSRQDLALYNARRIELHQRAQEILNRYSINYSLPKDVKTELERELKERSDASDAEFKRLREQVQGGGKAEPAAPAAKPAETLPPEAIQYLKEGELTPFKNGQTWTLKGGQPIRVK